ncbi:hypothetical protein PFISCL1PPCAC_21017, partial [Pristionchus fissidentatus]
VAEKRYSATFSTRCKVISFLIVSAITTTLSSLNAHFSTIPQWNARVASFLYGVAILLAFTALLLTHRDDVEREQQLNDVKTTQSEQQRANAQCEQRSQARVN